MSEPTAKQRRILSFFRRTEGITTLAPVYEKAIVAFPALDPESAIEAYWKRAEELERLRASEEGETVSDEEFAALNRLASLQFG